MHGAVSDNNEIDLDAALGDDLDSGPATTTTTSDPAAQSSPDVDDNEINIDDDEAPSVTTLKVDGSESGAKVPNHPPPAEPSKAQQPMSPTATAGTPIGRVTKFLALDKCAHRRHFLQILELPATSETLPTSEPVLCYDAEWLAILRRTHCLLSTAVRISSFSCISVSCATTSATCLFVHILGPPGRDSEGKL